MRRGVSPAGSRQQPPIATPPTLLLPRWLRMLLEPAGTFQASHLVLGGGRACPPVCACAAVRCGAVRSVRAPARASLFRGARGLVHGRASPRGNVCGTRGSLSPHPRPTPGRSPRFWNVLRLGSAPPPPPHTTTPYSAGGATWVGCPKRPCLQALLFQRGCPGAASRDPFAGESGRSEPAVAGGLPYSPHPSRAA